MKKLYSILTIFFAGISSSAFSQGTFNSNSAGPANWDNSANWTLIAGSDANGIPDANDDVTILAGHTRDVNVNSGCANLTINGTLDFPNNGRTLTVSGNLIMNGASAITGTNNNRILNVSGTFNVSAAAAAGISGIQVNITGATTLDGALTLSSNTGVKTFLGSVTLNAGGSWISTVVTTANQLIFGNGITQNGSSFSAGSATFNTNAQSVNGTGSLSFANVVTVTGITLTNNTTINMTSVVAGALTGTGTWTQAVDATLNFAGLTMTTLTLNASAVNNTINYNQGGAQTIYNPSSGTYYHLTVSTSGTKTLSALTDVNGNLSIQGTSILSASTFNITLAGNWNNSSTNADPFTEGTQTVTFDGSTAQSIINTGDPDGTTFYNLTLNNSFATSPQITLGIDATVINTLNMTSGIVNLATFTLTLGTSGVASTLSKTASSTTNWVYGGTFKRFWVSGTALTSTSGNFYGLFPTGTARPSTYEPFEVNTTSNLTANGFFTVNHVDNLNVLDLLPFYDDAGTLIVRIHNSQFITAVSGDPGGTYNVSATMTGLLPGTLSDIRLAIFTGGTTASAVGAHAAATGTVVNPTAKRTGITVVTNLNNDFRLSTINLLTPLPVELAQFEANCNDGKVDLAWTTYSEVHNDYFTIERSSDAINFEIVRTVDGAGNSNQPVNYFYTDNSPLPNTSFYRLKQTDFDGDFNYFDMVSVSCNNINFPELNVYPNPSNGHFTIVYGAVDAQLIIMNSFGQIVASRKTSSFITQMDLSYLPAGMYFVQISSGTKNIIQKISISK